MNELQIVQIFCALLGGGEPEQREYFQVIGQERHVRVDCRTDTHAIEIGYDHSASNRDSVHQAVFSAELSGLTPMVVLIDTDGVEGRYELEMRTVTSRLNIPYGVCRKDFIISWSATSGFRQIGTDKDLDDLPRTAAYDRHCDLGPDFKPTK